MHEVNVSHHMQDACHAATAELENMIMILEQQLQLQPRN